MSTVSGCCSSSPSSQLFELGLKIQQRRMEENRQLADIKSVTDSSHSKTSGIQVNLAEPHKGLAFDVFA